MVQIRDDLSHHHSEVTPPATNGLQGRAVGMAKKGLPYGGGVAIIMVLLQQLTQ